MDAAAYVDPQVQKRLRDDANLLCLPEMQSMIAESNLGAKFGLLLVQNWEVPEILRFYLATPYGYAHDDNSDHYVILVFVPKEVQRKLDYWEIGAGKIGEPEFTCVGITPCGERVCKSEARRSFDYDTVLNVIMQVSDLIDEHVRNEAWIDELVDMYASIW